MAKKSTVRQPGVDRILDAVLDLCAESRWRDVTMEAIAEAAGASMQRVNEVFLLARQSWPGLSTGLTRPFLPVTTSPTPMNPAVNACWMS